MNIVIIGAGPSGLVAAKEIAQANPGATLTLFEKTAGLGGGFTTSYAGLTLVNNPMLINFSDFLADETLPALRMWSAQEYVDYLQRYARHFQLHRYIEYNSEVLKARRCGAGWQLTISRAGHVTEQPCDYLVVCAGSNHHPAIPDLPLNGYTGSLLHAADVKDPHQVAGKHVLIIGLGETGSDLAQLASQCAKSVTVSIRRWPGYFIPRYHDTRPTDLDTSRLYHQLPYLLGNSKMAWLLTLKRRLEKKHINTQEHLQIQQTADHFNNNYRENRHLGPFRRASTKSCGFLRALIDKKVTLRGRLKHIEGTTAYFEDGHSSEVDSIICCTGYRLHFPFLPAELAEQSSNTLFNYMFPVETHSCLCFIGYVRPAVGSVPPLAELQSRILANYLAGTLVLPAKTDFHNEIAQQLARAKAQFPLDNARVTHLVDYFSYMKRLALQLGVMPKQWAMFRRSPRLWFNVNCAFLCPAMFRLYGSNHNFAHASSVIKRLPTMPASIIALEVVAHVSCRVLSAVGFRQFTLK